MAEEWHVADHRLGGAETRSNGDCYIDNEHVAMTAHLLPSGSQTAA